MARRLGCFALCAVAAAAMLACGSAPPKHFYTMVASGGKARYQVLCVRPLVLGAVEAVAPYDSQKIVYRTERYKINYYHYRMWAAEPEDMLEEMLKQQLQHAGVFPGVEGYLHSSMDHLALHTRIHALEEVDSEDDWTAHLSISYVLKDPNSDAVIWRHAFDQTQRLEHKNIRELSRVLSDIYNSETHKMIRSLASFISRYPGCATSKIGEAWRLEPEASSLDETPDALPPTSDETPVDPE